MPSLLRCFPHSPSRPTSGHTAAGDTGYIEATVSGGTPAATDLQSVFDMEHADDSTSLYGFGGTGNINAFSGLFYSGGWNATQSRVESLVAVSGTVTGYRVLIRNAPSSGRSRTFVLHRNGVAQDGTGGTPNTTIVISDAATSGQATFTLPLTVLDLVSVAQTGSGTPTLSPGVGSVTFVAATPGQSLFGVTCDAAIPSAGTNTFTQPLGDALSWNTTETLREILGPVSPVELSGFYASLNAVASSDSLFVLRKNGSDTPQTVTVPSGSTTSGPSGGAIVTLTDADRCSLRANLVNNTNLARLRAAFLLTDPAVIIPSGFNALLVAP